MRLHLPLKGCPTKAASLLPAALLAMAACSSPAPEPLHLGHHHSEARPDTPGNQELFRFDPEEEVEHFDSAEGAFRVHFTRDGVNQVPPADEDADGIPDYVQMVARTYEEVLAFYRDELGFRVPLGDGNVGDNGGDGRFDVYLVDFGGNADGAFRTDGCTSNAAGDTCVGFMVQENDFFRYRYPSTEIATRILASHEFFHAIQAAYDAGQNAVVSEGTAVWATEMFDPQLNDFEGFIGGYLEDPKRPLNQTRAVPVDPFTYGSGIFFMFLTERFERALIRELWEYCINGALGVDDPEWLDALDRLLTQKHGTTFAEVFQEFVTWNLYTGRRAMDGFGYSQSARYPEVEVEQVELPFTEERPRLFFASTHYFEAAVGPREALSAALVVPEDSPEDLDDLSLWVAVERNGALGEPQPMVDPTAGEPVDVSGADKVFVAVVNSAMGGNSRRASLCVGAPEELAVCRAELLGEPLPMAPDMEVAEAPDAAPEEMMDGGVPDEPMDPDGGAPSAEEDGGGGSCDVSGGGAAPLWLLFALGLTRRRRR